MGLGLDWRSLGIDLARDYDDHDGHDPDCDCLYDGYDHVHDVGNDPYEHRDP